MLAVILRAVPIAMAVAARRTVAGRAGEGGPADLERGGRPGNRHPALAEEHAAVAAVVIGGVVGLGAVGTGKCL